MSGAQGGSEGCPLPAHAPCSYKYDDKVHLASSFLSVRGRLGAESRGVNRQTAKIVTQVAASGVFYCAGCASGERFPAFAVLSPGQARQRRHGARYPTVMCYVGHAASGQGVAVSRKGLPERSVSSPCSLLRAKKLWKTPPTACGHRWLRASCSLQASARVMTLTIAWTWRFVARGIPVLKIALSPPKSLA